MNLIQLKVLDYDGSTISEYFFYTEKPRDYFCTPDYTLNKTFLEWLKTNKPTLYKEIGNHEIDFFYYHEDALEKI